MPLCELTELEIRKLTHSKNNNPRKGVKIRAVEGFLGTVAVNPDASAAYGNARIDAQLYKWNAPTLNAITKGIQLASSKKC